MDGRSSLAIATSISIRTISGCDNFFFFVKSASAESEHVSQNTQQKRLTQQQLAHIYSANVDRRRTFRNRQSSSRRLVTLASVRLFFRNVILFRHAIHSFVTRRDLQRKVRSVPSIISGQKQTAGVAACVSNHSQTFRDKHTQRECGARVRRSQSLNPKAAIDVTYVLLLLRAADREVLEMGARREGRMIAC